MKKNKVAINIIASVMLRIITIICGFVLQKLIIKTYDSSVNGLLVSIGQYIKYIVIFEGGLSIVIKSTLYKPIAKKQNNTIRKILKAGDIYFKRLSYFFIFYVLLLCIILPKFILTDFDSFITISLIIIIAISTLFDYYIGIIYDIYLQAKQKHYVVSNINILTIVANFIVCIILISLKVSIIYIKLATSLIYIVRPFLLKMYVEKKYKISLKNTSDNYVLEQKWNGFANHAAYVVHSNTDVILLSIFSNVQEISVYSIYFLIMSNIKNVMNSLSGGVEAKFGEIISTKNNDNLNKSFDIYEISYLSLSIIIMITSYIMLIPFIKIYMSGIHDVDYIRPVFASIMVLSFVSLVTRQPYKDIVESSGHFKQTQSGAMFEAVLNILLSIILVIKYGIVGVAIGTLVSTTIRTAELIIYSYKNILNRSMLQAIKRLISIIITFGLPVVIINSIFIFNINNYLDWILSFIFVVVISLIMVLLLSYILYRKEFEHITHNIIKRIKG